MKTTEDWLKEKVWEYEQDPKEVLKNLLAMTNDVMIQYNNNLTSKSARCVFDTCIVHNKLFLNTIERNNMKWISVKDQDLPLDTPILVKWTNSNTLSHGLGFCSIYVDGGHLWLGSVGFGGYEWDWYFDVKDITHFQIIEE